MSLRFFHLVFIAAAIALAAWTGWWSRGQWAAGAGDGWLWLALGCGAAAVGLAVYGVWFFRKTRGVSLL
jgi:hypothetical protein